MIFGTMSQKQRSCSKKAHSKFTLTSTAVQDREVAKPFSFMPNGNVRTSYVYVGANIPGFLLAIILLL